MDQKLSIFEGKEIRNIIFNSELWFSVVDACAVLTDSVDAGAYWRKLKQRLVYEGSEVVTICHGLKLKAPDGKMRETDCANTEGVLRIIQSIPSPKAEPFKRWLAKVGYERIQEIEDPELATKRTRELYRSKGYSDDWIEKRMRGIAVRENLTNEWEKRGLKEKKEYSILTAEICKATFGMTPSEYKDFKALKRENLRDHMTDLELIFSMLGESATTEITQSKDSQGFSALKTDANEGEKIAGDAKKALELKTGKKVSKSDNFLNEPEGKKRLK
ncbi:phage antirepressor protein [Candidatus Peregrinibacteria bacterium CG_4_10_14_0_2_um_filter_38_24]|nr:MAG: phage antirepressor protein [Candidatus Peregrinibacteria bacterium CG_4_10_14_0_2_um_filter_38_24]PJC38925.1 MAG: phage antirepressor protein [Candidatus Peregrinibacteria bacterium CG_4_9_14_0_2_um_filter_38_9]